MVRSHTVIPLTRDAASGGAEGAEGHAAPEPPPLRTDHATLLSLAPSAPRAGLGVQARRVLALCAPGVVSVAEVAAHLEMPGGVVRALVADLVARGNLLAADPFVPLAQPHEKEFLERILHGLQQL
ncbi:MULTISPECIES: DUF742 domain-containing protein [Streptomyces]|uniref:DUF742 domain-containing protein n=1 Tax=Streptomyces chilikensis TaxID=1194079 RepID=A0ABV3EHX9_9ACTN|nr:MULTISPECIES: DUF742 domain-containing protein [Streptomyces]